MTKDEEYFIATVDDTGNYIIYTSEKFKLSEFDLINLIRICLIEQRSKLIGTKILEAYRDSTQHKKIITKKRLEGIGIKEYDKPTKRKKPKTK